MLELTPSVQDVVEYQLPESVRVQENELFVKFIKYYYEWLTQQGQPTEFIHNLLSYRDVDLSSGDFRQHLLNTLLKFVPSTSSVDQILLSKHLGEFLRSKGTLESFEFIMRAVYGETIEMEWNSEKLLRPSASEYTRAATVTIESTSPWQDVEGSLLIQESPFPASASIESCTTTTHDGKTLNWLTLNEKTIIGKFEVDGVVSALKNTLNRNWYIEEEYYEPIKIVGSELTFKAIAEENRPYENLIVKQLNTSFRAVVQSFVKRIQNTNYATVTLLLKDVTGTFSTSEEIYIFAPALEAEMIIKTDYERGTVSPAVGRVDIVEKGSLYVPGDSVSFLNGSGTNVSAYISEVTSGPITEVNIVRKGYGYAIGDELIVNTEDSGGTGFAAEVSKIDGIGAQIDIVSELNDISIVDGGTGYKVNDEVEISGGTTLSGTPPVRIRVDSVDSTWGFLGVRIDSGGNNYPPYSKIALVNTSTVAKVAGFAATPTIQSGVITGITVTSTPTISTNALDVVVNGYGADVSATVAAGAITGLTINDGGVNYVDPVFEIQGDGVGAFILPVLTADVITGYTIVKGGTGYTAATVVVKERLGTGADLVPLFKDQTNSAGVISTYTILERGDYITLPPCYEVEPVTKVGNGTGAVFSLNFRAASVSVTNGGEYYQSVSTSVSGKGSGAILKAFETGGVVTSVYVENGGQDYYYGTTVSIPGGGVACSLTPVIVDGVITSVTINSGGSGYTPPEMDGITINSGTAISLNTTISGSGKVVNYNKVNGGTGYNSQSEVTPLSISLSGGTGAKFLPSISEEGVIVRVDVLDGGSGYQITDTFTVTGGGGSNASLKPVVFNGRVTDVTVENGGTNYQYGTYIIVLGDGSGAAITPNVETGITQANVINGGTNYADTTTVIITDASGTGAEIRPVIVGGVIVDLEIVKKGSGYVNPSLSLGTPGSGAGASITAKAERFIDTLTISNAGSGYTYAQAIIIGDGEGANFELTVEKLGTIQTASLSNTGTGYTSTPVVTITDTSGYGAVSEVKITNRGGGYRKLPVLTLADKLDINNNVIASGTKFTCFGPDVGGVRSVSFDNHGADYVDLPKPVFSFTAILNENAAFKPGERVSIQNGVYRNEITSTNILLENGNNLDAENGDNLVLDLDDTSYDMGVYATVHAFDFDRNMITLRGLSDTFYITDESGNEIITENEVNIVDQISGSFDVGDVIIGENSTCRATIGRIQRASGISVVGGNGFSEFNFDNEIGMLNKASSVIADNNRYQDRAYVIKCGRSLNDYMKTLKDTVHPAGYMMFGDVKTQTFIESNILNEIGYNRLAVLLAIYGIVTDGFTSEYSNMDDLFGEFNKFRLSAPISLILDYTINQTSEYSIGNVAQFVAIPMNYADMNTWTFVNGLQLTTSASYSPNGSSTMQRLNDTDTLRTSYVEKTVTSVIGNTYSIETFVGKQVNPLTYPEIKIGTAYIRLNTETGAYVSSGAGNIELENMGDYWWVRISHVATGTSLAASISPSRGFISNLNVTSNNATGSIRVADTYIRNITGLSPYNLILRARNSNYVPDQFRILATESDVVTAAYP